jgi:cation transport regulator ChaC
VAPLTLVFGYGSLVSPASAAQTFGREVQASSPVRLPGWRRRWSTFRDNHTAEKTFARAEGGELPRYCLGLNLEQVDGEPGVNGVLLELTEAELDRLDLREMRYRRTDVSGQISGDVGPGAQVIAYTAKPRHHAPSPPPGSVIIAGYVRTVEAAFAELAPDQLEVFRATTDPPPVEQIEGVLVRDRIPEGNPRDW